MPVEIEILKKEFLSGDHDRMNKSRERLVKIGGDEVINFFLQNVETAPRNSWERNSSALALRDLKANRVVESMLKVTLNPENIHYNGTLVYALEGLNCSNYFKEIFTILFYHGYEAKISAYHILDEQKFLFNLSDLMEIREMWEDCKLHPEKCPEYQESKKSIEFMVNNYLHYIHELSNDT